MCLVKFTIHKEKSEQNCDKFEKMLNIFIMELELINANYLMLEKHVVNVHEGIKFISTLKNTKRS